MDGFALGVDIGTTNVKCTVLEISSKCVVASMCQETDAYINYLRPHMEQDVSKIYAVIDTLLRLIPGEVKNKIVTIGVSGQMHGIILWNAASQKNVVRLDFSGIGEDLSHLITWEDSRCDETFLRSLPISPSGPISTGFGCATLFWLQHHSSLERYDRCGTVQDLFVSCLCDSFPTMTDHNAFSWGYFDPISRAWEKKLLSSTGFPTGLLPCIIPVGSVAGHLKASWLGLPLGIPVHAAVGDFQASLFAALRDDTNKALLNIGTSSQLAILSTNTAESCPTADRVPYLDGKNALVAASLNGGNVLTELVRALKDFALKMGSDATVDDVWRVVLEEGASVPTTDLFATPTLFGERSAPSSRASLANLSSKNFTIGHLTRAFCRGLIVNLAGMISPDFLRGRGVDEIVVVGGAVSKNPILFSEIQNVFGLKLTPFDALKDTAYGAALFAVTKI